MAGSSRDVRHCGIAKLKLNVKVDAERQG